MNAKDVYTYAATGIQSGDQFLLQVLTSGGMWKSFSGVLHPLGVGSTNGTGSFSYSTLGVRTLRLAVVRSGSVVAVSAAGRVRVYGVVPLATLLDLEEATWTFPTFTFTYVTLTSVGNSDLLAVPAANNTCRFVHVDAANHPFVTPVEFESTVSVVQGNAGPVSVVVPSNATASVEATLTPGVSWAVTSHRSSVHILANGYALCYSAAQAGSGSS